MKWLWLVAMLLVTLAGLSMYLRTSRDESSPPFQTSDADAFAGIEELVEELEAAGIPCRGRIFAPAQQAEEVGAEFGLCYFAGHKANIHVYEDPERVAQHVTRNIAVRGDRPSYFTSLVFGPNWVIDTYNERLTAQIRAAIGGTIR